MEGEDIQGIVIDTGSGLCKAGFSGDDAPRAVLPTYVGRTRMPAAQGASDQRDYYVGEEARSKCDLLNLKKPVERSQITDWEDIEKVWHHTLFMELRIVPDNHPLLLTEPPNNPKLSREKITQIMFESFNIPAFYLANQAVLSLYATGRTSGVAIDSGEGSTFAVPIYEGYALPYATKSMGISGADLTEKLQGMLKAKGHSLNSPASKELVRDIKEKLCYVAMEPGEELNSSSLEKNYELPDGTSVTLDQERFQCPEEYFNPSSPELEGIHTTIHRAINKSDVEIRKELFNNLVLTGGSTLFPGFTERIVKEMTGIAGATTKVKVVAPSERLYSVWIGGSVLAALSTFQQMWITKAEFDEAGPTIVNRKCF